MRIFFEKFLIKRAFRKSKSQLSRSFEEPIYLSEIFVVQLFGVVGVDMYIFYERDEQLALFFDSGGNVLFEDVMKRAMSKIFGARAADFRLKFFYDSHENVVSKYEGSYFLRMR